MSAVISEIESAPTSTAAAATTATTARTVAVAESALAAARDFAAAARAAAAAESALTAARTAAAAAATARAFAATATTAAATLPERTPNLGNGTNAEKKFQIEKESSLVQAAARGDLKTLTEQITSENINTPASNGLTPVYFAVENNHIAAVKFLLEKGAKFELNDCLIGQRIKRPKIETIIALFEGLFKTVEERKRKVEEYVAAQKYNAMEFCISLETNKVSIFLKSQTLAEVQYYVKTLKVDIKQETNLQQTLFHRLWQFPTIEERIAVVDFLLTSCANIEEQNGLLSKRDFMGHTPLFSISYQLVPMEAGEPGPQILDYFLRVLKIKVTVDQRDNYGNTFLHAISGNHLAYVKYFLESFIEKDKVSDWLEARNNVGGSTSFLVAAKTGRYHICRYYLERWHVSVIQVNRNNETVLHLTGVTARVGDYLDNPPFYSFIKYLLIEYPHACHACIGDETQKESIKKEREEKIRNLLKMENDAGDPPFLSAMININHARALIKNFLETEKVSVTQKNRFGKTILNTACSSTREKSALEAIKYIFEEAGITEAEKQELLSAFIAMPGMAGFPIFFQAAARGRFEIFRYLVERLKQDINQTIEPENQTAFTLSVANGHKEIAQYLLNKGIKLPLKLPGGLLSLVRGKPHEESFKAFLKAIEILFNLANGSTVIFSVKDQLEAGASIHQRDPEGSTLLHIAAGVSISQSVLREFLEHSPDLSIRDARGETPREKAVRLNLFQNVIVILLYEFEKIFFKEISSEDKRSQEKKYQVISMMLNRIFIMMNFVEHNAGSTSTMLYRIIAAEFEKFGLPNFARQVLERIQDYPTSHDAAFRWARIDLIRIPYLPLTAEENAILTAASSSYPSSSLAAFLKPLILGKRQKLSLELGSDSSENEADLRDLNLALEAGLASHRLHPSDIVSFRRRILTDYCRVDTSHVEQAALASATTKNSEQIAPSASPSASASASAIASAPASVVASAASSSAAAAASRSSTASTAVAVVTTAGALAASTTTVATATTALAAMPSRSSLECLLPDICTPEGALEFIKKYRETLKTCRVYEKNIAHLSQKLEEAQTSNAELNESLAREQGKNEIFREFLRGPFTPPFTPNASEPPKFPAVLFSGQKKQHGHKRKSIEGAIEGESSSAEIPSSTVATVVTTAAVPSTLEAPPAAAAASSSSSSVAALHKTAAASAASLENSAVAQTPVAQTPELSAEKRAKRSQSNRCTSPNNQ